MPEQVRVQLTLPRNVRDYLDELADVTAATPDMIAEAAITEYYRSRRHLVVAECPWHITDAARRDYLRDRGLPVTRDQLEAATDVLEAAAVDAVRAEREGVRRPVPQESGALRYRGPQPLRLSLYVTPPTVDQPLPQLVHVRANSGGRMGRRLARRRG